MPLRAAVSRSLALTLACALLTACGSPINQENFDKIKPGMTLEDVQSILGKPDESSSTSFGNLSGGSATWKSDEAIITVQFVNDKVQFKQYAKGEED